MITKQQLADAYLRKATKEAAEEVAHAVAVHAHILKHFPEQMPDRILLLYTTSSALLGNLRKPEITAATMLDTVRQHIARSEET